MSLPVKFSGAPASAIKEITQEEIKDVSNGYGLLLSTPDAVKTLAAALIDTLPEFYDACGLSQNDVGLVRDVGFVRDVVGNLAVLKTKLGEVQGDTPEMTDVIARLDKTLEASIDALKKCAVALCKEDAPKFTDQCNALRKEVFALNPNYPQLHQVVTDETDNNDKLKVSDQRAEPSSHMSNSNDVNADKNTKPDEVKSSLSQPEFDALDVNVKKAAEFYNVPSEVFQRVLRWAE